MTESRTRRYRFNVWNLLRFQVMIAPLFLAASYADYNSPSNQFDPFQALAWFVAPPLLYVFLLVTTKLRSTAPSSFVFPSIRLGIVFGILFGVLSWGPSGGPAIARALGEFRDTLDAYLRTRPPISLRMILAAAKETRIGVIGLVFGFWLLHYAVLGAASGAVAGVAMQCIRRKRNQPCRPTVAERLNRS